MFAPHFWQAKVAGAAARYTLSLPTHRRRFAAGGGGSVHAEVVAAVVVAVVSVVKSAMIEICLAPCLLALQGSLAPQCPGGL